MISKDSLRENSFTNQVGKEGGTRTRHVFQYMVPRYTYLTIPALTRWEATLFDFDS